MEAKWATLFPLLNFEDFSGNFHEVVAVGMRIAPHPPHRSGRAAFPHPALASGNDAQPSRGIGMIDTGGWQPVRKQMAHTPPAHPASLAAAT
jgi:hypothetical protein